MTTDDRPSAVLLAAGASRRFGRLKQLEPVGPDGEALIDYAIHDARKAGFGSMVLVVRPDIDEAVRAHLAARWTPLPIALVHQTLEAGSPAAPGRDVPWGTGHALLAAGPLLDGPFAVANADDFYGAEAWSGAAAWLMSSHDADVGGVVAYRLDTTLSENGGVSRAVFAIGSDGFVENVTELFDVRGNGNCIIARDELGAVANAQPDAFTSMNLWTLQPGILAPLRERFRAFLREAGGDTRAEFRISTEFDALRKAGHVRIQAIPTTARWMGVTYVGDGPLVRARIARLVEGGHYPARLGVDQLERTG